MKNKGIFWYIIIGILLIFLLIGAYKTLNNHHNKEYLVVNKKILEAAKKCYKEDVCENNITLKYLYDNKYLSVQIDPITKENMKEDICITFKDNEAIFCDNQ